MHCASRSRSSTRRRTPQAMRTAPAVDTAAWIAERDSAQARWSRRRRRAVHRRAREGERLRSRMVSARPSSAFNAPPVALLAAALVFGVALGFGSAFVDEMRHPRVSDEHEVERVTGARVLATIGRVRDNPIDSAVGRRDAPPYFDPGADGYQLTYLHVARTGASRLMLTIAGEDTAIAAVVGDQRRRDRRRRGAQHDHRRHRFAHVAGRRGAAHSRRAGRRRRRRPARRLGRRSTSQATVGRDRVDRRGAERRHSAQLRHRATVTALFRQEAPRLSRHYEAIVDRDVDRTGAAAGFPARCRFPTRFFARASATRASPILQSALDGIRAAGGNPLGIVLWDAAAAGAADAGAHRATRRGRCARRRCGRSRID